MYVALWTFSNRKYTAAVIVWVLLASVGILMVLNAGSG
jgi:hypothetical protein